MGLSLHNPYEPWALETAHDVIVFSEQHRLRKPEPEIYELALALLGLPGPECIFVDDNPPTSHPPRSLV
ncbi:HAD-IA family hydrolase [Streptomyces syringium]|uniref:HAD-IA family hydrolase n=1 Tax=Streptomyces syringium TaxID=76729 RepID=UPI0034450177